MDYFPVNLSMFLKTCTVMSKTLVLLEGQFVDDVPDVSSFKRCVIHPSKISKRTIEQTTYLEPIKGLRLVTRQDFGPRKGLLIPGLYTPDENGGLLEITFNNGSILSKTVFQISGCKHLWELDVGNKPNLHLLVCQCSIHPKNMIFGVVTDEWVKRFIMPMVDSK